MNKIFSIVFVTVLLITFFDGSNSAVVKHSAGTIRKPISKKYAHMVHSPITFNLFKRGHRNVEYKKETNEEKLFQDLQPRADQASQDNSEHGFMVITTTTQEDPFDSPMGSLFGSLSSSGGEKSRNNGISMEMTIIDIEEPQPSRRVAKKFGSNGPFLIASSSRFSSSAGDDSAESYFRNLRHSQSTNFGQSQVADGLREALQQMFEVEAGDESPIKFERLFEQRGQTKTSASTTLSESQPPKLAASSPTSQAEKPQMSYSQSTTATETSTQTSDPKPAEPVPFTQNQNKQILLGSTQTFDNTSHHSQL